MPLKKNKPSHQAVSNHRPLCYDIRQFHETMDLLPDYGTS